MQSQIGRDRSDLEEICNSQDEQGADGSATVERKRFKDRNAPTTCLKSRFEGYFSWQLAFSTAATPNRKAYENNSVSPRSPVYDKHHCMLHASPAFDGLHLIHNGHSGGSFIWK